MIVDGKGDLFEDRRKANNDRRKRKINSAEECRKEDRRKTPSGERNTKRKR